MRTYPQEEEDEGSGLDGEKALKNENNAKSGQRRIEREAECVSVFTAISAKYQ